MNTAAVQTSRKNIDIREDVYRFLSIKAAASGTNLKSYIEALLEKEVEERTLRTGLGYEEVRNASCLDEITDCKKLVGYDNVSRIRIGSLRAFFIFHIQIIDDCVFFKYLVPRGEAYDKKYEEKLKPHHI